MKSLYRKIRIFGNRIALKSPLRHYYLSKRHEIEKNKSVTVEHFDRWTRSVRLSVYLKTGVKDLVIVDPEGRHVAPRDIISCATDIGARTYFWIDFPEGVTDLQITCNGVPVKLRGQIASGLLGKLTLYRCRAGQYSSKAQIGKFPLEIRILRKMMSAGGPQRNPYTGCWLFADRTDKADDNAEHFYRFVTAQPDAPNAYFILARNSVDWARLKDDGFKLIEFESPAHLRALAGARFVISSQATPTLRYPIARKYVDSLCKADFIFLQHGIIATDCSGWINKHNFKLFVTSTPTEYNSITDAEGPYNVTPSSVVLTGMPRFDNLFLKRHDFEKELIAVMPTWRAYLAESKAGPGSGFKAKSNVKASEYYQNWVSFLTSAQLRDICIKNGKKVALLPHPIFRTVFSEVEMGDHIYFPPLDVSYQDIILRSAMCITDYSSVANDMAAIDVPIVHFAFPEKEMAAGKHTSTVDLDAMRRTAMGPVLTNKDDLLREVAALASTDVHSDIFSERRAKEFGCCDGQASARIYEILCGFLKKDYVAPPIEIDIRSESEETEVDEPDTEETSTVEEPESRDENSAS